MNLQNSLIVENISSLLEMARKRVAFSVNHTMVLTYFEIGKIIVEEEQNGQHRAEYGKFLLKTLSKELTKRFGRGFSQRNLEQIRQFYLTYSNQISQTLSVKSEKSQIPQTLSAKSPVKPISELQCPVFRLSWSHYLKLMRIKDENERRFYEIEAIENQWSIRELQRQYDTALYTRLALSKNKEEVKQLSEKGQIIENPKDLIKDPYILEFLGLPEKSVYSESDLEQNLIDKLEHFLLELGKGFTFVSRQERITFDEKHFRIDLVFYNRILRCFV